jgi:hypothetical protein
LFVTERECGFDSPGPIFGGMGASSFVMNFQTVAEIFRETGVENVGIRDGLENIDVEKSRFLHQSSLSASLQAKNKKKIRS